MSVISSLRGQMQENCPKIEAPLFYIARSSPAVGNLTDILLKIECLQPGPIHPFLGNLVGPCSWEVTILMLNLLRTSDQHSVL